MRLLLVTHYFPGHGGGIERVAAELETRLSQNLGWQITWVASETDAPPVDRPNVAQYLAASCWNGIERRLGAPWPIWSFSALRTLWREMGDADVVHLHDALYFGNVAAWLFARLRDVPVVVTQHVGDIPFRSTLLRRIHAFANRTVGRLVMEKADQAIFVSPAVRDAFTSYCRFRVPPIYCPNGVDTTTFTPVGALADDPQILNARRTGMPVLLFVGRFVEKKGIEILRELAQTMPNALWVFAGRGPLDPGQWELHNVHVVRGQSGEGLARYYRAADLLVLPSVGEGFPLVVQESMACGTPAMVGEETAEGCPDARPFMMVEKIGSGDTAARWARRLTEQLQHADGLRALRAKSAQFAREHWSWEVAAQVYSDLFRSLAERKIK